MINKKENDLFNAFQAELAPLVQANARFSIALSGGLDSVVLLHLFSRLPDCALSAHHVHHGLSANGDHWGDFCATLCDSLDIPFTLTRVLLEKESRTSIEALARQKRYAALKVGLSSHCYLVTAHHQDDQLETILLALKRGAGLTGLQGIVAKQALETGYLIRPLLNFSREQLENYATDFDLRWIEDESNQDQRFDRNFIRHSITPLLKERWPAITQTVARSAAHCQTQQQLIDELSASDLLSCQLSARVLHITQLKALSPARRNNVLRYWFKQLKLQYPSTQQLRAIWHDIVLAQCDAMPKICLQGNTLCRYQQGLYFIDESKLGGERYNVRWQGEEIVINTGYFTLKIQANDMLENKNHNIDICFRKDLSGNLQCRPSDRDKSRSLKKLLQEYHVPPWLRDSIPFVFVNEELTQVVSLFNCKTNSPSPVIISII